MFSIFHQEQDGALNVTVLSDKLEVRVVEMPKLLKVGSKSANLVQWVQFFKYWKEPKIMAEITIPEIHEARRTLEEMQADRDMRMMLIKMDIAEMDRLSELDAAEQKGRQEGQKEGRIATARSLLTMGMQHQLIAEATKLSLEEVQALAKS